MTVVIARQSSFSGVARSLFIFLVRVSVLVVQV